MIESSPINNSNLPDDIQRQLIRVEGYLDLKMADQAARELLAVDAEYQEHFYYRWLNLNLLSLRKQWKSALPLIRKLREEQPDEPGYWIQEAYITRRASSITSAQAILEVALEKFPDDALIHYNLACYACQLDNVVEAKQRLKDAIDIDDRWINSALNDDDLEPIHDEIEEWLCT